MPLAKPGASRVELDPKGDLTELLDELRAGCPDARDRLVNMVYDELRRIAGQLMRNERPDHTLQPSALVHEALIRLLDGNTLRKVSDRRYFFAVAGRVMRQVLVDHARRRGPREVPRRGVCRRPATAGRDRAAPGRRRARGRRRVPRGTGPDGPDPPCRRSGPRPRRGVSAVGPEDHRALSPGQTPRPRRL